jgi:hypothetical protein
MFRLLVVPISIGILAFLFIYFIAGPGTVTRSLKPSDALPNVTGYLFVKEFAGTPRTPLTN